MNIRPEETNVTFNLFSFRCFMMSHQRQLQWLHLVERALELGSANCPTCQTHQMPLRDAAHPFGFPWLQGISLTKVLQSNILYSFVVDVLFFAFTHNIVVSIENPLNSWLWVILKELVMQHPSQAFRRWFNNLEAVEFSNCAWVVIVPK